MGKIGELLRQWRRRRELSQLDLALAAEVSPRYVSLVETGKSNPSPEMILRLAAQLDVPLRERNQLLLTAGFAPRFTERTLDGDGLGAARTAVARVLTAHEPYPALVLDRRWNIVMTNSAVEQFFVYVAPELLRPPINMIRLGLDPRGFAPRIVNLTDVRTVLGRRVARQLVVAPDEELRELYEELLAVKTEAPTSFAMDSDIVLPMIFRFDGHEVRLFSTITTFGTPMDITLEEIAIESYYPADDASAAFFETRLVRFL